MATSTGSRGAVWSPARVYLVASGVLLLFAAAVGFGVNSAFPASSDAVHDAGSGHIFGVFETNGWHNLSTAISGAIALGFALRPEWARTGALLKGAMYLGVTVSIALWGPETFRIASNGADQVVHASLAATALWSGLLTPRAPRPRLARKRTHTDG